ncbi:MAG: hypothetical protein K9L32_16150 [Chromatiaceae bacterium]|nr:hypothetical protein [Chromatiaceae bacterium]
MTMIHRVIYRILHRVLHRVLRKSTIKADLAILRRQHAAARRKPQHKTF